MNAYQLVFILTLVIPQLLTAEEIPGWILQNGDTRHVVFEMPFSIIRAEPKFEKIQNRIEYFDEDGNLVPLYPDQAEAFGFVFDGDTVVMVSRFSNLDIGGRQPEGAQLPKVFLRIVIEGDLTLYSAYVKTIDPEGGSWAPHLLLQKKGDYLVKPPRLGFRKFIIEYLGDCIGIDVALDKKRYKREFVAELVHYYNSACAID